VNAPSLPGELGFFVRHLAGDVVQHRGTFPGDMEGLEPGDECHGFVVVAEVHERADDPR
jgi:hypothetical protein